jgi:hypothetical protein
VDFAEPGGMATSSRSVSPRATASSSAISRRWCAAGARPNGARACAHHAPRLRRTSRRRSSSAAAAAAARAGDGGELVVGEGAGVGGAEGGIEGGAAELRVEEGGGGAGGLVLRSLIAAAAGPPRMTARITSSGIKPAASAASIPARARACRSSVARFGVPARRPPLLKPFAIDLPAL